MAGVGSLGCTPRAADALMGFDPELHPELEHVKAPGPNIFVWHPFARYLMGF